MKFNNIKVSTKTIIAITNLEINIEKLFDYLQVVEYIVKKKKRGRKKKDDKGDLNKDIKEGSIITLKYQDKLKGVDRKKKKATLNKKKYFRNALTVVTVLKNNDGSNKLINFKISKNGKFQITGCKTVEHAKRVIKYIWAKIKKENDIYKLSEPYFKTIFNTVMTNIDFNIGYIINREELNRYINEHTEYNSLLETSFGYTGVNIKIPIRQDLSDIKFPCLINKCGDWIDEEVNGYKYLKKKKRYNTFLAFHSGNIIMSGMTKEIMEHDYNFFIKILNESRDVIREKLDI